MGHSGFDALSELFVSVRLCQTFQVSAVQNALEMIDKLIMRQKCCNKNQSVCVDINK